MPTFTPRRYTVEAHQWRGAIAEIPLDFARKVELQGWRPPLVHIGDGTKIPMPEGSWIVLGVDGRFEVLPDGAFQHRYEPALSEPEAVPQFQRKRERQ